MSTPIFDGSKSILRVGFFTLAGVSAAELQGDRVVGVQKDPLLELRPTKNVFLSSEFVNWANDADGILRFTRRYGALEAPTRPGQQFSFDVGNWQQRQLSIRRNWDQVNFLFRKFSLHHYGELAQHTIPVEQGEMLVRRGRKLEYKANTLFRLVMMEFASIAPERLRKCVRPNCQHPYFIARHLGQSYCSSVCARWAQREWKKQWWSDYGKEWRQDRQKANKGGLSRSSSNTKLT